MVSRIINDLVSKLNPREKSVVSGRFGLETGKRQTLQEIGEQYGITRERVRQIEAEALRRLAEEANRSEVRSLVEGKINRHLDSLGGVRKEDLFIREVQAILNDAALHGWHLRFLSEIIGIVYFSDADKDFHPLWYSGENVIKNVKKFQNDFEKAIKGKKDDLIAGEKFNEIFKLTLGKFELPEAVGLNYLSVSRHFGLNPFGDFGLSEWKEINPKTVRDRAYLALKKENRPLHFREVTNIINRFLSPEEKSTLSQTVHNELIKDDRVALVGRGTYALKLRGYISGTTREIIVALLERRGPMYPEEIINQVSKQRILKENTIMLALQNRKHFKRLPDGKIFL